MIEQKQPPSHGKTFPAIQLHELALGTRCFVWMRQNLFSGTVIDQSGYDQWTRIETAAARFIRAPWRSMSFRWVDGLPAASRCDNDACVIVPDNEEQARILEEIVRQCQRPDTIPLRKLIDVKP